MRKIRGTAVVLALATTVFASGAQAIGNGGGNSALAPGQARALENCLNVNEAQTDKDVVAGGGKKAGNTPVNCDHSY